MAEFPDVQPAQPAGSATGHDGLQSKDRCSRSIVATCMLAEGSSVEAPNVSLSALGRRERRQHRGDQQEAHRHSQHEGVGHRQGDDGRPLMEYVVRGLDTCRRDGRWRCAEDPEGNMRASGRAPIEERRESPETSVFEWFDATFPASRCAGSLRASSSAAECSAKVAAARAATSSRAARQDNGPEVRRARWGLPISHQACPSC